jgi:hypothetical protein
VSEQSAALRESGTRLLQAGDYAGAIGKLQEALSHDPQDGKAHGLLGVCQARLGDLNAALQSLNTAAELQPTDPAAHYNLANALFQANRLEDAKAQAQQTLALNPEHENAKQLLTRIDAAHQPAPPAPTIGGAPPLNVPTGEVEGQPSAPWTLAPPMQQEVPPAPWAQTPPIQPAPAGGLHFNPATAAVQHVPPSSGLRFMRGIGWGILFGQWWTLWTIISSFIWSQGKESTAVLIVYFVIMAFAYAFVGALVGLVIAGMNADPGVGAIVGVVAGLLFCGLEVFVMHSAAGFINVIFYYFTGRYIGANIAARVQRPLTR